MGALASTQAHDLEPLIEALWSNGGEGRQRVHDLLSAIDKIAPEAVERTYSLQVGRRLGLSQQA